SLAKTLANKQRTSMTKIFHKYRATVATPHGPLKVLEVRHERGEGKAPLIARFGGIALRWHRHGKLNDQPKAVFGRRSEIVQRILSHTLGLSVYQVQRDVHYNSRPPYLHNP